MKIRAFAPLTATLDLDPTDLLVLADALACALYHDQAPDRNLTAALRATLEACAVIAATDTLRDNRTPEAGMLEDTRRVWGPFDHATGGLPRVWSSVRSSPAVGCYDAGASSLTRDIAGEEGPCATMGSSAPWSRLSWSSWCSNC